MRNPPQALPEVLQYPIAERDLGLQWRIASILAGDLADTVAHRLIPIVQLPEEWLPLRLGLAATVPIPGVVISGGRRSLLLARWLAAAEPMALEFVLGPPDGLILAAGVLDRWIVATVEDESLRSVMRQYEARKLESGGLHFLLVEPDDSGMTYSGFWLLKH
jgi:hypothetical protein